MLKKIIVQIFTLNFVLISSAQSGESGGMPQESKREESEKKIKEFEKIILESKLEAKNYFNVARQKILDDINSKRLALEKDIDEEISAAEQEVNNLKINSHEKIRSIAVETSSELIKQLIGEEANNSSISAIVEEQSRKSEEKQNGI